MYTFRKDSRGHRWPLYLVMSGLLLGYPSGAFSQEGAFTTFDVPGASYAFPLSMNEEGGTRQERRCL